MRKILESCPTCGGSLTITEVRCDRCGTEVRSQYQPCPFCRLTPEQMNFAMLFVQSRGNLSDLEKALGVSYPTIRGKLDEIIKVVSIPRPPEASSAPTAATPIQVAPVADPEKDRRREILNQVASGNLNAADALAALRGEEKRDG